DLAEIAPYALAERNPLGKPLGDLAMTGDVFGARLLPGEQPARDRRHHLERPGARIGAAQMSEDERHHLAGAAGVDEREVAAKLELVAEQRDHRVGLGGAADVAQQRVIIALGQTPRANAEHAADAR